MTTQKEMEAAKKYPDWNMEFKQSRLENRFNEKAKVHELLDSFSHIRAVTVCFSDLEGRLHRLDYDKEFLIANSDNLTFDGSSIRGFTAQNESDLKLSLDWSSSYFLPPEHFGSGKLFMFGEVCDRDDSPYPADIRSLLKNYLVELKNLGMKINVAAEIEGFVFEGINAEQRQKFVPITEGGYFNTLPQSPLRRFIDDVATVQRFVGFENEKDHPEVAPAQFELNWSYTDALIAADQIQLYKMICRQLAATRGMTASFLPKPLMGVNGSGMHINISISDDAGWNVFYDASAEHNLSQRGIEFSDGILNHAKDLCLILNPSVNAYRRLDPAFEAPINIKCSADDRGAMIRIPLGNERSARLEIRSVAPDANPYLVIYSLIKAGLSKSQHHLSNACLPADIYCAIEDFEKSDFIRSIVDKCYVGHQYIQLKRSAADRCPRELGRHINPGEILYHHEVTNQIIWENF